MKRMKKILAIVIATAALSLSGCGQIQPVNPSGPDNPVTPVSYTVSFNANGGSGEMNSRSVTEGSQFTLPSSTFTAPEGKEFAGWKVNNEGDLLAAGAKITVSANVTLYAQWKDAIVEHTVSFKSNGGSGLMAAVKVVEGEKYTLPSCGFTAPSGQKFAGWKVNNEGETLMVGSSVVVNSNISLYAQWKGGQSQSKEAFKKIENLSDLSVNIQSATSLGLNKNSKPAAAKKSALQNRGAGTENDPYTVTEALELCNRLEDGANAAETVYVKGIVVSDNEDIYYNATYHSASFMMSDGVSAIKAYSISGCSVTEGEEGYVAKGYEVVVGGVFIKYIDTKNGNAIVPEVGYSNVAKNTTVLISSVLPKEDNEDSMEPSNVMVMTSNEIKANDPNINADGTMDVSFTKIDTTVTTKEVDGEKTLIASAKEGDSDEVVIKEYGGSTITFESDTKHQYRVLDKNGKVIQDWFDGKENETTTDRIEGTYATYEYVPTHAGTKEDPYTVTEAFNLISELSENGHDNETVYVKGTITSTGSEIYDKYNWDYSSVYSSSCEPSPRSSATFSLK